MSAISWLAELQPLTTSQASSGWSFIQSWETQFATGISTSFYWPGSGGGSALSAGESKPGNIRLARAGNSAITGGYENGFLLWNTARGSIDHIGSVNTGMYSHSAMLDMGQSSGISTSAQSTGWLVQTGSFTTSASSWSILVSFATLGGVNFLAGTAPNVYLVGTNSDYLLGVGPGATAVSFPSFGSTLGSTSVTVTWRAEGLRQL